MEKRKGTINRSCLTALKLIKYVETEKRIDNTAQMVISTKYEKALLAGPFAAVMNAPIKKTLKIIIKKVKSSPQSGQDDNIDMKRMMFPPTLCKNISTMSVYEGETLPREYALV
jgi:hypothetical protein